MNDSGTAQTTRASCWLCGADAALDERYRSAALYRCGACGFLFAPERSTTELHELYTDDYFDDYTRGEAYTVDQAQRRFEANLRISWVSGHVAGGRLMEVGAANGTFLRAARDAGFDVFGIEPAPGLAQRARELSGAEVATGFIEDAELPDEPFDAICAWHVLEHIPKPQPSLQRLRRVVRDDGWLFLEIPNITSVRAQRKGTDWLPLDPENHVGFYTPEQLADVLGQAGFELQEAHSVSALSYYRPRLALRPSALALRAYDTLTSRTLQSRPHPHKHELLRAVARPV